MSKRKRRKVLRKLVKYGLIIALLFLLLSAAIDILNNIQQNFDIFIKKHNQQSSMIEILQQEIEILKAGNLALESRLEINESSLNEIKELINNPNWSSEGVTYQYKVIESKEFYDVIEIKESSTAVVEMPGFFSHAWIAPIIVSSGLIIKSILTGRIIPAM